MYDDDEEHARSAMPTRRFWRASRQYLDGEPRTLDWLLRACEREGSMLAALRADTASKAQDAGSTLLVAQVRVLPSDLERKDVPLSAPVACR